MSSLLTLPPNSNATASAMIETPAIVTFPKDIFPLIFRYLNAKDVVRVASTCHAFDFLAPNSPIISRLSSPLWNLFLHKDFPDSCVGLKSETESLSLYKHLSNRMRNIKAKRCRLQTLKGHQRGVTCLTVWGNKLISGSRDGGIKIWDLEDRQELQTLGGDQDGIHCMTLWGNKLISGSWNGRIKIWDLEHGQEQTLNRRQSRIHCMTVWDDKLILGSSDSTIEIWDLKHGQMLKTLGGDQDWIDAGQGVRTLSSGENRITCLTVWDGKLISSSSGREVMIQDRDSKFISISPDSTIKIWDLNTGQEIQKLNRDKDGVACLTVWGDKLISGSMHGMIKIWDLKHGQEPQTLDCYPGEIRYMTIWDDKLVVFGVGDETIKIWDLNTGQEFQMLRALRTREHNEWIGCMAIWDGKFISGSYDSLATWNFNDDFPSLSPYSKQVLKENLKILEKMSEIRYPQPVEELEELAEELHPDFKERLREHSLKLGIPFASSDIAILRVQTEVCLEALLNAIYAEDHEGVSGHLMQLITIDPWNIEIFKSLREICGMSTAYRSADYYQREGAAIAFKQLLKDHWDKDF